MHKFKYFIVLTILFLNNNFCCAQNNTFKIAIVGPFTGLYQAYGKQLLLAANKAINSSNLELIPFDDQCNIDIAKSIATQIISDPNIKAVIGHSCPFVNKYVSKIYAKHGILQFIPIATSPEITEQNINTLFRMCGSIDREAQFISNFIAKQFNNKKIAILHTADIHNKELAEYLQESLVTLKIFPALYQNISIDFINNPIKIKNLINKLKKLKIDIIVFNGLYKETANFIKIMRIKKIQIPLIINSSTAIKGFKAPPEVIMSFQKLEKNTHIKDLSILGYAAIEAIHAALLNNHNYPNNNILANWLHQNKINTVLGEKSWDLNGNIINDDFAMYIWDNNNKLSIIN